MAFHNIKQINMNQRLSLTYVLGLLISLMLQTACSKLPPPRPMDLAQAPLIPRPVSLEATGSSFRLTDKTAIYVPAGEPELERLGQYLASLLNPATGLAMAVKTTDKAPAAGSISLSLTSDEPQLGEEGYELVISNEGVSLRAARAAGLFYGIQTLRQLLPAAIERQKKQEGPWEIASGAIRDYPTYAYRGAMLDVSRHFFGLEDVKRYIDLMSLYKLNTLHLHLSDDQGWRIEIKSWPKLTTIGGSTQVGGGEGGYYTQEQYRELVQYARERYINIIPEIDMPGHTNAALASYAELNCDGQARELYTGMEVGFSTLCTTKEITYQFIDDVFRELAGLTPGPYIHIGGDESHVTPLEEYIPFIERAQQIVAAHGKQVIGWDEIAHARLNPGTIVQYWAKAENAQMGAAQGAKVLFSPAAKAYLDMKYDSTTQLGLKWAGYIEVDSAYLWDPAKLVEGISGDNILGVEAPLWTETLTTIAELEYMAFPRLPGIAEIGWSPAAARQWEDYRQRLGKQKGRFEALGINYYPSKLVPWED